MFSSALPLLASIAVAWLATMTVSFADGVNKKAQDEIVRTRRLAALRAATIDTESIPALIAALEHENVAIRFGAVFLLKEKKARKAIPALEKALGSKESLLDLELCSALLELGAPAASWRSTARKLVTGKSPLHAIRAAGLLAQAKDPSGWKVVDRALRSKQPEPIVSEAAHAALSFERLTTGEGAQRREVPVFATLTEAFKSADEGLQRTLIAAFGQTQSLNAIETLESWEDHARSPVNLEQLKQLAVSLRAARRASNPKKGDRS